MYSLVSAKVKTEFITGDWWDDDISALTIRELVTQYKIVHLTLSNNFVLVPIYADLHSWLNLPYMNVNLTLAAWFTAIGNTTLPVTQTPFYYENKKVKYRDAFMSRFDIRRVHPEFDPELPVSVDEKIDLMLSKDGINQTDFTDYCLVSVNGYMHCIESTDRGIYVRKGAEKVKDNDERNVGILSFANVAKVTIKPFTDTVIYTDQSVIVPTVTYGSLADSAYIKTGVDLSNKSVLLSIGGYLHVMDDCYSIIGEELIRIDFKRIPLVRRLLESKKYINLDSLNLTENEFNSSALAVEEILSDDVIRAYLHLSQSFLIIVDTPNLYVQQYLMENGRLPGIYFHPTTTMFPMVIDNGRLAEYLEIYEEGKTQYRIIGNKRKLYMFETIDWKEQVLVDNTQQIYNGQPYAEAVLLEIGTF